MHPGWRGCIGRIIFIGHFPQKSPIISGSLAERDPQLQASCASLPPCSDDSYLEGECMSESMSHV